jgi:hypothetical protein
MHKYSRAHLSSDALDRALDRLLLAEHPHNAEVLSYVAEIGARRLYRKAGFPTMYAYLIGRWHLSESAAYKRARAARAAREFPVLFEAVADGRLHMSGIAVLAPHLTADNLDELIVAGTHKTKAEIEQFVAERFPRPDMPFRLGAIPTPAPASQVLVEGPEGVESPQVVVNTASELSPGTIGGLAEAAPPRPTAWVQAAADRPKVAPIAPQRFALQLTISGATRDKLRRAQELLGYQVAPNDVAKVLDQALDALVEKLEKRKCAMTSRPRQATPPNSKNPRYIPAEVKRRVRERDGDRCTFVSESGQRCPERKGLEHDHILEVARGGEATVANLRLRCRAHNQHAAECTFGEEFMRGRREASSERRLRSGP